MTDKQSISIKTKASFVVMGLGQLLYHQWVKGLLYMGLFAAFIWFMITQGVKNIIGIFTLGTQEADAWAGILEGDNSITMLLIGIMSVGIVIAFVCAHVSNIRDILQIDKNVREGKALPSFPKAFSNFADKKFHKLALGVPIAGVLVFTVLPIVFMILLAFTNYGGADHVPPKLVDWVGLYNFQKIFSLGNIRTTFVKILGWNVIWAFLTTGLNYFGGLGLALLLNKQCVKGKAFWRSFPILAYAVPGFVTLLGFKFMFSLGGPINHYIKESYGYAVDFLNITAGIRAKIIGLGVNAWLTIPTTMLMATGILSNMNTDLYEAASIDGAGKWKQFIKITLPFVIFSTTPVLITSFIGNFNNFGVFYFLRGGLYSTGYFNANDTDLLINWLYNLSIANDYYSVGAAVSLIIFVITSIFSLTVYVRSAAYKKEDTYR